MSFFLTERSSSLRRSDSRRTLSENGSRPTCGYFFSRAESRKISNFFAPTGRVSLVPNESLETVAMAARTYQKSRLTPISARAFHDARGGGALGIHPTTGRSRARVPSHDRGGR